MQFIYHKDCPNAEITLEGKDFHYIFGVRRESKQTGKTFKFTNLKDNRIYFYTLKEINKKMATFKIIDLEGIIQDYTNLLDSKDPKLDSKISNLDFINPNDLNAIILKAQKIALNPPKTHIIQAIIDNNDFDKILPFLNELYVDKITLFYADFSQRNQKINLERLTNILINSSMQCGRLNLMKIEVFNNLDSVLEAYKNCFALDFGCEIIDNLKDKNSFIIGAEGGFSKRERELLKECSFSINHPLILKSQTASIFIASQKI